MKKSILFLIVIVFLTGCASTNTAKDPEEPLIWRLLKNGDDRARDYFQGEYEVNIMDAQGRTPLHYAVSRRDASLARFFLALGADPNALDFERQSALGIALENHDVVCASVLANGGARIHLPIKDGATAASLALSRSPELFKSILSSSTVAQTDSRGKTVLHLASIAGKKEAVLDILPVSSSASYINKIDNDKKNALDYAFENASSKNHLEIAEQLVLSGGVSENDIYAYFAPAARSGNYNLRRNEGLAPVHFAVMGNQSGIISFLLDKNIDINLKSTSGSTALHEAVRKGNLQIINLLMENGADVNARDAKGNTPLHTGSPAEVHLEVITALLENSADPNLRDEHGDTPLHIAIMLNRQVDVAQALLNGGAEVHIRNIKGQTPLFLAVHEKRESVIPVLLSYGAELFAADNSGITPFDVAFRVNGNLFNLLVTPETVTQRDTAGNTLLHATVRNRGTSEQIGKILDQRPLVDATNRAGDTALHIAVRTNQRQSGEYLLSRGADIFSNNAAGESPLFLAFSSAGGIKQWIINSTTITSKDGLGNNMLHYAALWKFDEAIPVIIRNGVSVESANATGETSLFMAVKADGVSTIRVLVEQRANINARDNQGNSLLHAAVRWNALRSARLLISSGMDVNVFSLNGNTPLHDAVILGMSDIETLLIREKANLEVRNVDGNTPFMEAVRAGFIQSMQKLSSAGADSSTRNIRGDTPLHIAVSQQSNDIVNMLLRMGASIHALNTRNRTPFQLSLNINDGMVASLLTRDRINIQDDFGNSALHIALLENSSTQTLKTILNKGARIDAVDSNGKTPLRIALDADNFEAAKFLADSGASPFSVAVDNKTPAEISFSKGEECLRALFSGRAISAKDSQQNTILHFAARYGSPQSISVLYELGANRAIRNISSELPYEIAVRWNREENAQALR